MHVCSGSGVQVGQIDRSAEIKGYVCGSSPFSLLPRTMYLVHKRGAEASGTWQRAPQQSVLTLVQLAIKFSWQRTAHIARRTWLLRDHYSLES